MNLADGFLRASLDALQTSIPHAGGHPMAFNGSRFLADWLPILIFLGLLLYFMFAMRKPRGWQRQHLDANEKFQNEQLAELRRLNASLERITDALRNRGDTR